jgi:hypothetical protein
MMRRLRGGRQALFTIQALPPIFYALQSDGFESFADRGDRQEKLKRVVRQGDETELTVISRRDVVLGIDEKPDNPQVLGNLQNSIHGIEHHVSAKTLPLHVACHCQAGKLGGGGPQRVFLCEPVRQFFHKDLACRQSEKAQNLKWAITVNYHERARDSLLTLLARRIL